MCDKSKKAVLQKTPHLFQYLLTKCLLAAGWSQASSVITRVCNKLSCHCQASAVTGHFILQHLLSLRPNWILCDGIVSDLQQRTNTLNPCFAHQCNFINVSSQDVSGCFFFLPLFPVFLCKKSCLWNKSPNRTSNYFSRVLSFCALPPFTPTPFS